MTAFVALHLAAIITLSADYSWLADIQPVPVIQAEQTKIIMEVQSATDNS